MAQGAPRAQTRLQVFDVLDRLEAMTSAATKLPLTNRAVINPAELQDLVARLRHLLPTEIQEAQQILRYRDSLISRAQAEAKRIRDGAEQESLARISEQQVVKDAQRRAEEIGEESQRRAQELLAEAQRQAEERIQGADAYAQDVLRRLEGELATLLATARRGLELLGSGQVASPEPHRPRPSRAPRGA